MRNRNILIIAYYYPPKGGAGVQRTAKFAKYLSKYGFDVHVLTVKEDKNGLIDESLKIDIKDDIKVYRTDIDEPDFIDKLVNINNKSVTDKSSERAIVKSSNDNNKFFFKFKKNLKNLAKKVFLDIYNLIYIPDDKKGWIKYAVPEAKRIIKENNIELIYTTSSPYTTHMIGYELANEMDIKWIADFRDPWASNPFVSYSYVLQKVYNCMECKVVNKADMVISVSKPIIDDFIIRYPKMNPEKFVKITNGYDEEDFKNLDLSMGDNNECFTILYNGTMYGKETPNNLFSAIDNLLSQNKIDRNKFKIKFVGNIGHSQMDVLEKYKEKYPKNIERMEYIIHKESLKELCRANALLLIIDDAPGNEGIYTGKIFEYIRTGKDILAIVPDGAAKDLIIETNTGYIASPLSVDEIEKIIFKAYENFFNKKKELVPNYDKVKNYSRENLTLQLISYINKFF